MNKKRLIVILALVLFGSLVLSACSGRAPSTSWHGLTADAERAYLSNGSFVYAIDLKTGKQVWQYPTKADSALSFYAAPVLVSDQQLLVGSAGTKHALFSLDPKTGIETWAEPFSGNKGTWLASPLVFNDTIYAPNADGFLYVIDLNGKQAVEPLELGGALWSAPVTDGNLLYVSSLDHHLHIIDPATSKNTSVELGGAAPSSPVVGEGGAYVGSFDATIQLVAASGQKKTFATAENWIWGTPILDGSSMYYADLNGNIVSLDVASGKQNWNAAQKSDSVVASLLVHEGQVYAVTENNGKLLAFDPDGKLVWEKTVGGKIYTAPVAAGGLILVAPFQADFALAAYDQDGKQAWTFTPAE